MRVSTLAAEFNKPRRLPLSLGSQAALFVALGAVLPVVLLLVVGSSFFANQEPVSLPFGYWAFLVVVWVLGTVLVVARVFSSGIESQLEPLKSAAEGMTRGTSMNIAADPSSARSGVGESNEIAVLAERFNQIELALADGRAATLGRIQQLEEENRRLRDAVDLQSSFLAAVSHEIRTPLSAMVSAARIIQHYHAKKPEVVDRFGDTISSEGKRLGRLVGDLFDVVRLEAGNVEWSDREVRPDRLVVKAVRAIESSAAEYGLSVHAEASETLPTVWGDEHRLDQVLEKLLDNALKFTPRGGSIHVSAAEHNGAVRFTVRDTGPGVSPSEQESIFDKTHMIAAHSEKRSHGGGTGLGLSICRGIVERHRGKIWVSSQPDSGAVFQFELPTIDDLHIGVAMPTPVDEDTRVLLLTNNDVVADAAVRALRLEDIEARVCSQMQEVFGQLTTWSPDVVVVSSSFVWQLTEGVESRMRKAGVTHILMLSPHEGLVEMSPPTHSEPLLRTLSRAVPAGAKVLLAEEDAEYNAVVEFELAQAGYEIIQAFDGHEAVDAVINQRPTALVLDLLLPGMDGFEVLEKLAESSATVPTVVLTSLNDDKIQERLLGLGAIGVFGKHELIQSRSGGIAERVKQILRPILESGSAANNNADSCVA